MQHIYIQKHLSQSVAVCSSLWYPRCYVHLWCRHQIMKHFFQVLLLPISGGSEVWARDPPTWLFFSTRINKFPSSSMLWCNTTTTTTNNLHNMWMALDELLVCKMLCGKVKYYSSVSCIQFWLKRGVTTAHLIWCHQWWFNIRHVFITCSFAQCGLWQQIWRNSPSMHLIAWPNPSLHE